MSHTAEQIIAHINEHLGKSKKQYFSEFYIGITKSIEDRLFGFHQVPREGYWRIHRQALNSEHARFVEKHFLDNGMKGGGGGGDHTAVYVYCYEVSQYTNE